MTDRPIVFVDCETTALGPLARPWEIAAVRRDCSDADVYEETEYVWHVAYSPFILPPGTNQSALEVGGWWQRGDLIGAANWLYDAYGDSDVRLARAAEWAIARRVHEVLAGAVLIGVGVHFDAAVLSAMFSRHCLAPEPWHYAIVDLKAATWGQLQQMQDYGNDDSLHTARALPMKSEQMAEELGVAPPTAEERHTALGDARWAARWFDALVGAGVPA
ncbi:3'-5' exoribonuclease [Blastococcus sp. CCUG 61487]|uniref:3'-5' exoribonuclease domain-containing protein n=1 Tax=Blastococcus sp. CCUG 61487 TaxID=1840703 RepID=UPI0010BFE9BE|nr:3'-5' exoribonuclease [Blastococcus sp. CCUG 61487]TKJ24342.1 hypothetical protein A6V29_04915 [Blastococcus sp. CCUG 61487]